MKNNEFWWMSHLTFFADPPVVDVAPTNITTNETREVMIYCTYEANPTSLKAVRW